MSDQAEDDSSGEIEKEEERKLKEVQEKPIPAEGMSDNVLQVLPSNEGEEKEVSKAFLLYTVLVFQRVMLIV
jgi:hypothetical protein